MTQTIEVLDSLPGTGKTTAIFDYMQKNQSRPWLYLSPIRSEIDNRVGYEADRVGMSFYTPKDKEGNLAPQVIDFLKQGKNIACTHSLTLYFTQEHIDLIKSMQYNVVCDEELNLIDAYPLSKADTEFLISEKMLYKDLDNFGRMSWLRPDMHKEARYGDIKRLCDRGCLYGERHSDHMLVTYLSPDLIVAANRFVLLTYQFEGSIMATFLKLHNIQSTSLNLKLFKNIQEVKSELKNLLEFVEPPSVKSFLDKQNKFTLSSSWWESTARKRQFTPGDVKKMLASLKANTKVKADEIFITTPSAQFKKVKSNVISQNMFVACNTRATNELSHKTYAVHAVNLFPSVTVNQYLNSYGFGIDEDIYALNMLIQWVFRGCIRQQQPMKLTILSSRMKELFLSWLDSQSA